MRAAGPPDAPAFPALVALPRDGVKACCAAVYGRLALCDVVVDRPRLPAELGGAMAAVACVGGALSREEYEELLSGSGLRVLEVESRDRDAATLAERVEDRLRGARLLGLDRVAGAPIGTDRAVELVGTARRAISDRALGYAILTAEAS